MDEDGAEEFARAIEPIKRRLREREQRVVEALRAYHAGADRGELMALLVEIWGPPTGAAIDGSTGPRSHRPIESNWWMLTEEQRAAVLAYTREAPDDEPNGSVEAVIDEIEHVVDCLPRPTDRAAVAGVMARLCSAMADSARGLRAAFGLAEDGVTPTTGTPRAPRPITAEDVDQALAGAGVVADLVEACGGDEEDEEAQRETCEVIAARLNVLVGLAHGAADGPTGTSADPAPRPLYVVTSVRHHGVVEQEASEDPVVALELFYAAARALGIPIDSLKRASDAADLKAGHLYAKSGSRVDGGWVEACSVFVRGGAPRAGTSQTMGVEPPAGIGGDVP